MSDVVGAKDDLNESTKLVPGLTQSWVKLASVYMEQGDPEKTFECFEEAIKQNSEDPDIYYHRGQGLFYIFFTTSFYFLSLSGCRVIQTLRYLILPYDIIMNFKFESLTSSLSLLYHERIRKSRRRLH